MKKLSLISLLSAAVFASPLTPLLQTRGQVSGGTLATPGGIEDIIISSRNTLNGTYHSNTTEISSPGDGSGAVATLAIDLVNTYNFSISNSPTHKLNAYLVGKDSQNRVTFVGANGQLIRPSSGGSGTPVPIKDNIATPIGDTVQRLKVPVALSSARIYFVNGDLQFFMVKGDNGQDSLVQPDAINMKDPNAAQSWGFVEFTYGEDGTVYANLSYVDFIGIPAGMRLSTNDGKQDQLVKSLPSLGMEGSAFVMVGSCGKDYPRWSKLAINHGEQTLRVLSPNSYMFVDPSLFGDYFDGYIDQVWSHYSSNDLTVDTQKFGKVKCRVSGGQMRCDQGLTYGKPTTRDIWSCSSGPFVNSGSTISKNVGARICAAFVRTTLLLPGGNVQPSLPASKYYPHANEGDRTSYYGYGIHTEEIDSLGYAFPYDDVNPTGENAAGVVQSNQPKVLTFYVGGYKEKK